MTSVVPAAKTSTEGLPERRREGPAWPKRAFRLATLLFGVGAVVCCSLNPQPIPPLEGASAMDGGFASDSSSRDDEVAADGGLPETDATDATADGAPTDGGSDGASDADAAPDATADADAEPSETDEATDSP